MIQLGFVLHHATCEEMVEIVVVQALSPSLEPSGSGALLKSICLELKPNKQKDPNNKRFQSKAIQ
jgi:hypothetical protein